jgi:hypothetical protein
MKRSYWMDQFARLRAWIAVRPAAAGAVG